MHHPMPSPFVRAFAGAILILSATCTIVGGGYLAMLITAAVLR